MTNQPQSAARPAQFTPSFRVRMWRDRATRNKWVYTEERMPGVPAYIGVLYLDKEWLAGVGDPQTIEVTVEARP
jgi:hypothetical protein